MKLSLFLNTAIFAFTFAAPVEERAAAPTVTFKDGTVVGSSSSNVDSFKGIPFAQPPVGQLRLKPPQTLTAKFGTLTATATPRACPQFYTSYDSSNLGSVAISDLSQTPFGQAITNAGEDCLTLNVQRPSGVTSNSSLPVLVWIYGGGFEFGSTQNNDGSPLVTRSVSLGKPILYVEMNYRLGGFGFLGGKDLANEHSTNLGLRDQRLALQWVADNIAAFGGDPTEVTIWGESAGSISVADQTLINGGDNTYNGKSLFRGAMMDSGSIIPADTVTGPKAQLVYDTVVNNAGCSAATNKLSCLRGLSYSAFQNAVNSVPSIFSYRSVDLAYLPRPDPGDNFFALSPEISLDKGAFTKVPVLIGDQEDEGTLFSLTQTNITTPNQTIDYLTSYFLPNNPDARQLVSGLASNYPEDLGVSGSPFRTGVLNNIYPEFKRLAAILGDVTFTLTRRVYLARLGTQVPTWSYLSSVFYGTPVLGTFHASDLIYAYGNDDTSPTVSVQTYYISFVNSLDPNTLGAGQGLLNWPRWTSASPNPLMNFLATSNQIISDDFREGAYQFLLGNQSAFRI